jgi:hypothetical protein
MGDIADEHKAEYEMMLTLSAMGINNETPEGISAGEWETETTHHKKELERAANEFIAATKQFKKEHPVKYFFFKREGCIRRCLKKTSATLRYWKIKIKVWYRYR